MKHEDAQSTCICPRNHLIAQLEQGLDCKITLICAPEGYGKSTLLKAWSELTDCTTAFVETSDDTSLLESLIQAAQTICPDVNITLEADQELEVQIIAILNQLACLEHTSALIIDEYESTPLNDRIVSFLAEYLPPTCHLYIASNNGLNLSLIPRLRVRRQLIELTTRDLEFDQAETLKLLSDATGIEVNAENIEKILEATHGRAMDVRDFAFKLRENQDVKQCLEECPDAIARRKAASSSPSRTKSPQASATVPSVPIHLRTR